MEQLNVQLNRLTRSLRRARTVELPEGRLKETKSDQSSNLILEQDCINIIPKSTLMLYDSWACEQISCLWDRDILAYPIYID